MKISRGCLIERGPRRRTAPMMRRFRFRNQGAVSRVLCTCRCKPDCGRLRKPGGLFASAAPTVSHHILYTGVVQGRADLVCRVAYCSLLKLLFAKLLSDLSQCFAPGATMLDWLTRLAGETGIYPSAHTEGQGAPCPLLMMIDDYGFGLIYVPSPACFLLDILDTRISFS